MILDLLWHVVRELKGVLMGMTINMDGENILYKCRMHNHLKKSHTQPQRCRRQQRVPHRWVSSPCLLPPPSSSSMDLQLRPPALTLSMATSMAMANVDGGNGCNYGRGWRRRPQRHPWWWMERPSANADDDSVSLIVECPCFPPLSWLPACNHQALVTWLDTSKACGWGGRDWHRQRILGSIKSRQWWWWLMSTTANVDNGDICDDDQCRQQRWISTHSSSVATIIIGDIITMVPMAVEQTSTQGRKEPWHYQGMITGRSWPVASHLTGRPAFSCGR
jgi:hypothetical protein